MLAIFSGMPKFCPQCGNKLAVGHDQYALADWQAHCSHSCDCGFAYQLADGQALLDAATESGGDMETYWNRDGYAK